SGVTAELVAAYIPDCHPGLGPASILLRASSLLSAGGQGGDMAQRHAAPDIRPMKIVSSPSRAPEIVGEIAALLRSCLEGENLGAKLKFDYGEAGVVFIDGRRMPNKVHTRDEPADCTVKLDPFLHLRM